MALYSDKVMDHFLNPRNVGSIEDANAVGEVGNAKCGDIMKMYLKIEDGVILDAKFETFGCASAIAGGDRGARRPACAQNPLFGSRAGGNRKGA